MEQTLHIKLTKVLGVLKDRFFYRLSFIFSHFFTEQDQRFIFCNFLLSSCPLQVLKEITVRVGVIIAGGKKFSALKFHLHREKIRLPQLQRALAGRS